MFKLGEMQELKIVKRTEHGVYLSEDKAGTERVLLPAKQVPYGADIGDELKVFIYRDSKDRLIATLKTPLIMMGQLRLLKVVSVSGIGAFVDWGLEKDLLLPFKQQTGRLTEGEDVLCALYEDKSGRLCLTMKIYEYLEKNAPYKEGDNVSGRVYEISDNFGAFVAVDDKYSALIPLKEMYGDIRVNREISCRVARVTEDGKLTLACRKKAYLQMDEDAEKVMHVIEESGGVLPFTDKASPEVIKREFNMSKNEFKRAVGRLYRDHRINILEKSIIKV